MAYNETLADRIRHVLTDYHDLAIAEKKMFGGVAFMVNDKMAIGVTKDNLMVRYTESRAAEVLSNPNAREMDFTGKPMKGFLFVDAPGYERDADLKDWIATGVDFALNAPEKPKKKKS